MKADNQILIDSKSDDLGKITGTLVKIVNTTKQNNV